MKVFTVYLVTNEGQEEETINAFAHREKAEEAAKAWLEERKLDVNLPLALSYGIRERTLCEAKPQTKIEKVPNNNIFFER